VVGVICYPIVTYFYIVHVLMLSHFINYVTEINIHLQVHVQSTLQDDSVRHIVVDLAYTCIVTEIELVSDLRVGFPRVLWFPLPIKLTATI
jgi:hypothetical protein